MLCISLSGIKGVFLGYDMADNFMESMESFQIRKWMKVATILGLMVVGCFGSFLVKRNNASGLHCGRVNH